MSQALPIQFSKEKFWLTPIKFLIYEKAGEDGWIYLSTTWLGYTIGEDYLHVQGGACQVIEP